MVAKSKSALKLARDGGQPVRTAPWSGHSREGTKTIAALTAAWESAKSGKPVRVKYEI